MTKIDELKKLAPQQRAECLERLFQKNKIFFTKNHPAVGNLLRSVGAEPYHIHVTDDFLTITNTETGELCHPEVGLDRFAETLGGLTHNAWIDLIEGRIQNYADHGEYSKFPLRFQESMIAKFPGLTNRMEQKLINLPSLPNGKHFSNSVIFLGVFHGLHIDYYLSHTQLQSALFIEPEPARFVLSCYFLDYQKISERFGTLLLHVGAELPDSSLELFFNKLKLTGAVWTRVLPGYTFEHVDSILQRIQLKWRQCDVWHPADWQLNGIYNAMENINTHRIFAEPATLPPGCRIAVVGAGPSLSENLQWLKKHQDQFVIFAVHSAVSALNKVGIKPDFQFSFDIHPFGEEGLNRLQLDPLVPIVNTVCDVPDKFANFKEVLMLVDQAGINPVRFNHMVPFIAPTTGNMALAFACWCRPEQVYLFGLDFGFKEAAKTHVAESTVYQTEAEHKSVLFSGHLPVVANFSGSEVVTQSYFNLARVQAQNPISMVAGQVEVFNCSDGARIEGAAPCRADEIKLRPYDKNRDVNLLRSMFIPLQEGVHWTPHPLEGKIQLEKCKKAILSELKMTKFNWLKFSKSIDDIRGCVIKRMPQKIAQNCDNRLEPYLQVADLLLRSWYRFLCFTNDAQEWQQVYDEGYAQFSSLLNEMTWPEEL